MFLENRAHTLDAARDNLFLTTNQSPSSSSFLSKKGQNKNNKHVSAHHTTSSSAVERPPRPPPGCTLCKGRHFVVYCPNFLTMDASRKKAYIGESRTCRNCLRVGHLATGCPSQNCCRAPNCQAQHHTLLHECYREETNAPAATHLSKDPVSAYTTNVNKEERLNVSPCTDSMVLLATASIILESPLGAQLNVRALVDPASECSFVTEHVVQFLALAKKREATPICGVGDSINLTSQYTTELALRSKINADFNLNFSATVLAK